MSKTVGFNYKQISETLLKCLDTCKKDICIFIHKNADGDCLGAGLGLGLWLQNRGFNAKIISSNNFSENYTWMPNSMNLLIYDSIFKNAVIEHIEKSNLIFCVDFSQKCRIDEELVKLIENKNKTIFVIDHHLEESEFKGFNFINNLATSTCEMLYEVLKNINKKEITEDIAKCIYVGIITDTGKFMTSNMNYHVHEIAAELLKSNDIDVAKIQNNIYCNNRLVRMRFLGHVLSKCLRIIPDCKTSYISISQEDYSKFYLRPGDTDGIVNYGLSLKGTILTAMFNEKKDGIYISFRSVGDFAVNEFAKTYFNGGGHKNAAGGFSKLSLKETVNNFVNIIKKLNNIQNGKKI